jgi:hypothetical protein
MPLFARLSRRAFLTNFMRLASRMLNFFQSRRHKTAHQDFFLYPAKSIAHHGVHNGYVVFNPSAAPRGLRRCPKPAASKAPPMWQMAIPTRVTEKARVTVAGTACAPITV